MNVLSDIKDMIFEKEFLDLWFRWIGYFLIVATLVATGVRANSLTLLVVGGLSCLALIIHANSSLVSFAQRYSHDQKNARANGVSIVALVTVLGLFIGAAFQVIEVAIGDLTCSS